MANTMPPVPTLGELHATTQPRWVWLYCRGRECSHKEAAALAPFVIRWGPDASSDKLRESMVCKVCGHKGVDTFHPSWADSVVGWQPFPVKERR